MHSDPMNRMNFEVEIPGGFATKKAEGRLPGHLPTPLMLNLGCGRDVRDGFINIDLYSDDPSVVAMDVRNLQFQDNTVDLIIASDILEHFSHREVDHLLHEWSRVLKPGGKLIIRCPSLKLQAQAYLRGIWNADVASYMIFGGQTNPGDYHHVAFDPDSIKAHLEKAGIEVNNIEEHDLPQDKGYINLNMTVDASKKAGTEYDSYPEDARKDEESSHIEGADISEDEFAGLEFDFEGLPELDEIEDTIEPEEIEEVEEIKPPASTEKPADKPPYLNLVWEGSQFVYHSLALVNREHCINIANTGLFNLTIIPYESDRIHHSEDSRFQIIKDNDIRFKEEVPEEISRLPYIWIRHQWPPKEEPPKGAKWIIMQPWEYTALRKDFAELFRKADEVWVPSNFTREAFLNSGIDFNKVQIIPNGINPEKFRPDGDAFMLDTNKKLKILFVGGTIYRKGIDVLLKAYLTAFSSRDDVSLIIKDMGGESFYKGQTAKEFIEEQKIKPEAPEIIYIEDYLKESEMASLYRACDIFISPFRGEGFSLPTLEAMACGLPVVVTGEGAAEDFITDDFALRIDALKKNIGNVIDGMELTADAFILEPQLDSLIQILRSVYESPSALFSMGLIANSLARTKWNWDRSTIKLLSRVDYHYGIKSSSMAGQKLNPDFEDSLTILGEAEKAYTEGNKGDASVNFNLVLEDDSLEEKYRLHALCRLAAINIEDDELDNAEKLIDEAWHIEPDSPDILYLRSVLAAKKEKIEEALELVTGLMDNWSESKFRSTLLISLDDILTTTGEMLLELGDLEGANSLYISALKMNPENPRACFGAGECFRKAGVTDEAINMYEWALKLDPEFEEAKTALYELKK